MSTTIIVQGITIDDLLQKIKAIIDFKIEECLLSLPEKRALQYYTRSEVANLLKISLPTLHDWTKLGLLKSHKVGNRVYYRADQLQASIEGK